MRKYPAGHAGQNVSETGFSVYFDRGRSDEPNPTRRTGIDGRIRKGWPS